MSFLQKLGFGVDDVLRSSLSILIFFVLIGAGLWFLFRRKLAPIFFAGFGVGGLYLLWVNSRNNTGSGPGGSDPVFQGNATDAAIAGSGGIAGDGLIYVSRDAINNYL